MRRVLTNGKIKIGVYKFSDRKRPALCIEEGNAIRVYGYFHNEEEANEFMEKLGNLVGAVIERNGEWCDKH